MTDSSQALSGHHDLLALIKALGNDDADGAHALLDQLSPEELRAVTFHAAKVFSLSSPETQPDHTERTMMRFAAQFAMTCLSWHSDQMDKHLVPPQRVLREAIASGDPVQIAGKAIVLDIAVRAFIDGAQAYMAGLKAIAAGAGVA
ncbi:hypothetical protein SCD75_09615 [Prescottella equi]|nr:hypothetical protein SCD75_09615 [Prescottella equi]